MEELRVCDNTVMRADKISLGDWEVWCEVDGVRLPDYRVVTIDPHGEMDSGARKIRARLGMPTLEAERAVHMTLLGFMSPAFFIALALWAFLH